MKGQKVSFGGGLGREEQPSPVQRESPGNTAAAPAHTGGSGWSPCMRAETLLKASLLRRVKGTRFFGGKGGKCRTNAGSGRPLPDVEENSQGHSKKTANYCSYGGRRGARHDWGGWKLQTPLWGGGERREAGGLDTAGSIPCSTEHRAGGPGMGLGGGSPVVYSRGPAGRGGGGEDARRGFPRARSCSADARALLPSGQMGRARGGSRHPKCQGF